VGSGVAALAAATFLIRDGGFDGPDIQLFEEEEQTGGSLDAAGTAGAGYIMRGGRMFEAEYRCRTTCCGASPHSTTPRCP
jgi:oleate hydratase